MVKYSSLLAVLLFIGISASAQRQEKALVISGYGEVYYGYDFNQPDDNTRPGFIYSHNRHNEVNINLAMLHAAYEKGRVRSNIGVMMGTYANANLAAEPGVLKNIYEANVGVRLHKRRDLWVDAGVFPAHIGAEGAISMDCPTLTRSLTAEGSPYYESGVRLSYASLNQKWYIALMHLNGWQRIQRPNGYTTPAGGMQITFTPNKRLLFNLSTFVGSDSPDSLDARRYFIDLYTVIQVAKRLELTATLDLGNQTNNVFYLSNPGVVSSYRTTSEWLGANLILKYKASSRSAIVARGEVFDDYYNVINGSGTPFQVMGFSLGYDRQVTKNVLWRIEGKTFQNYNTGFSVNPGTFERDGVTVPDNYLISTSLAIRFDNVKNHK